MARGSDSSIDHLLLDPGPHVVDARRTAEAISARGCSTPPGSDQHVVDESLVQAAARSDVGFNFQFRFGQTTSEELEQLRFVMPLPLTQDAAHRQAADFFPVNPSQGPWPQWGRPAPAFDNGCGCVVIIDIFVH
eukprot:9208128-Pyramimonas_sp.AAC.1